MFAFFAYYVNLDIYFTQIKHIFQVKMQKNHKIGYRKITIYNLFIFVIKLPKYPAINMLCLGHYRNPNIFEM